MGVMDRYGRDKQGNSTNDRGTISKKNNESVDIEIFIQQSYKEAWHKQNGQVTIKKEKIVTSQEIRFTKENSAGNNRIEYIDTKDSQYCYRGKDHVYPHTPSQSAPVKESFLSKIKRKLKK